MRVSQKSSSYITLLTVEQGKCFNRYHNLADNMRELSYHMQFACSCEYVMTSEQLISESLSAVDRSLDWHLVLISLKLFSPCVNT